MDSKIKIKPAHPKYFLRYHCGKGIASVCGDWKNVPADARIFLAYLDAKKVVIGKIIYRTKKPPPKPQPKPPL